jgi:hypothetical protein
LFWDLAPLSLEAEFRNGSIAFGLTTAHARDGLDILRTNEAGRPVIASSGQFRRPNDCADVLEYTVSISNVLPMDMVLSWPFITGSSALSRMIAGRGRMSVRGGSSRIGSFGRIPSIDEVDSRRSWVLSPGARLDLVFHLPVDLAREVLMYAGQEHSLRYVLLTSVGPIPMQEDDALYLFSLTDTDEGRRILEERCVGRMASLASIAPVQGPRSAQDLIEQFYRERIGSRFESGLDPRVLPTGSLPRQVNGGLSVPSDPRLGPAQSTLAALELPVEGGPSVFTILMQSTSKLR